MSRLTGLAKPRKSYIRKITDSFSLRVPAVDQQCPDCKRYFQNVRLHRATGTACKQLRGIES